MIHLVDSHCHLDRIDLEPYGGDLSKALAFAESHQVTSFLCVCIDMENFAAVQQIAATHSHVYASVGLHPNERDGHDPSVEELVELASKSRVIAIGETGLDYFRSEGDLTWQHDRFRRHITASKETGKPLIIHTRDAREDTIRIMQEENASEAGGVMHCFTETWEMAQAAMEMGFYISFSGIITFKNAIELQELVQKVPLESMLIETDSPYLAPMPYRGKSNQPAYVRYVAEKVAELRGMSLAEVGSITTANFKRCFKLD